MNFEHEFEYNFDNDTSLEQTIQLYVTQQLKGDALQQFKQQLSNSPSLLEEVQLRQRLLLLKEHQSTIRLNEQLTAMLKTTAIQPDYTDANRMQWTNLWKRFWSVGKWGVGLLLTAVIGVSLYQWTTTSNAATSEVSMIQPLLKPYANKMIYDEATSPPFLVQGFKAYSEGDYALSIENFNQYLEEFPNHQQIEFYLGIAYLYEGQPNEAIRLFEPILQNNNALLAAPSKWYAALAYTQINQRNRAKILLQDLPTDTTSWRNVVQLRALLE